MSSAGKKQSAEPRPLLGRLFRGKEKGAPPRTDYLSVPPGISYFHVTHWKAGSQWVRAILEDLYGPSVVAPENFETQVLTRPVEPNKVYMCVYVGKQEFDVLNVPAGSRRVVLIRDLRDTLISAYFSIRFSHVVDNPLMEKWRTIMTRLNE